jgi:hypothetical protein
MLGDSIFEHFRYSLKPNPIFFELTDVKLSVLCHALEVVLKGWLAFKGIDVLTNKNFHTHDLEKLFDLVIEECGTYFEGQLEDVVFLNQYYQGKGKAYHYPLRERQIGFIQGERLKQLERMITDFQDKLIQSIQAAKAKQ